jgi:hypothetical protein
MVASQAGINGTLTPGSFLIYAIDPTLQALQRHPPVGMKQKTAPHLSRSRDHETA